MKNRQSGDFLVELSIVITDMKIKDLPKVDRPREKLISKGAQNLKDED